MKKHGGDKKQLWLKAGFVVGVLAILIGIYFMGTYNVDDQGNVQITMDCSYANEDEALMFAERFGLKDLTLNENGTMTFWVERADREAYKVQITVTNKRVYGCDATANRVDLPLDSITAVGTSLFSGLAVTTASGSN